MEKTTIDDNKKEIKKDKTLKREKVLEYTKKDGSKSVYKYPVKLKEGEHKKRGRSPTLHNVIINKIKQMNDEQLLKLQNYISKFMEYKE
ncbi:MAG: hypothetical protein WC554_02060 [Clostridia bacterium]